MTTVPSKKVFFKPKRRQQYPSPIAPDGYATKGYRYRLYPNQAASTYIARLIGHTRYVYNTILTQLRKEFEAYEAGKLKHKPSTSISALNARLTVLKNQPETAWLYEVSSVALQQTIRHLHLAFARHERKLAEAPSFKKRRKHRSATLATTGFRIQGNKLLLGNLKDSIKVKWSRELPSTPSSCTISTTPTGEYYVSFICKYKPTRTSGTGTIGIDAGITDLATMSDGTNIPNPRHYQKLQRKLAIAQRKADKAHYKANKGKKDPRKQKPSNNQKKLQLRVAKIHRKIANQRKDFLHKLSTQLVNDNQVIAIESLQVRNMVKMHTLAKHLMDTGQGMFRDMLVYKTQETQKGLLVLADPYFPSTQLCHCCSRKPTTKIPLSTRKWTCEHCGSTHQRDHNAAKNLEHLGKLMLTEWLSGRYDGQVLLAPKYTPRELG